MKKTLLILLFCTNLFFGQYTLIPDPVFEQNLINKQLDNDGLNGHVLTSNISSITQLSLTSLSGGFALIYNLQGIEGFMALEKLELTGNDGGLSSISITNNFNLKELYFYGNYLNNLVVSAPLLEKLVVENPIPLLQTLDINNCPKLNYLNCSNNQLSTLDVSNNPELEILLVYNNNLEELVLGNNLLLKWISCYDNQLTFLNFTNCPQLQNLYCWNNVITTVDLTNCPQLTNLGIHNNSLTSLNVTQNIFLKLLECSLNNLIYIDVSQNTALQRLGCRFNNLTTLNLQNNPQIIQLGCQDNNLTTINLQNGSNNQLNGNFVSGSNTIPRFNATNNPNLTCILVNDVANCQVNWTNIDPVSNFVASKAACDNLLDNKLFNANKFAVYPNPTSNSVYIDFGQILDNASITLTNILGNVVAYKNLNNLDKTSLDINGASGIYFLEIVNKKFEKQVFKIVKN